MLVSQAISKSLTPRFLHATLPPKLMRPHQLNQIIPSLPIPSTILNSIDQCRSPSSLPSLKLLHSQLPSTPDPSITIRLMRAYSACGQPSITRQLFDETSQRNRNIVFFNVMIRSYVNNCQYPQALSLFSVLSRCHHPKPDNYTYPCALKACSGADNLIGGRQIHAAVKKIGLDVNLFVGNSLIAMYFRCNGETENACKVFDEMVHRDVVSWNAMLAGFAQCGQGEKAVELCREMVERGKVRVDAGTMASLLPAMTGARIENVGFVRKMFDEMGSRDVVAWNAMIAIYMNNSIVVEAVEVFSRMEEIGIECDEVTFASVLPACGVLSALSIGRKIHECIKRKRMCPNLVLENALVDMYANCGCLKDARKIFDGMGGRDVVSWTSIISAYGMHGCGQEAVSLFEKMLDSGLKPDHIAFVSILSACSYSGLLDHGKRYFKCMTAKYKLVPRIEHFACMVDLLGRAGCIDEAYDFIRQMPIEPNERVWGALLGACRVHSDTSVGLIAADNLFKLVPEQSGYYVLLSNIYARASRWEDVTKVRNIMISKGIKKLPGCSNVEIGNKVHTFHIGDCSHPQSKKIYAELDVLIGRIKEAGYVADIEATLHDVEEEDRESHLSVHSEKLAIAFAMISTRPGTPIRVTMNLRTCGDCHHAAKLISNLSKREIILRDTNRFHHFKHGVCSCGDYW